MADTKQDKEIERDPEEVLRRMLNTPPKPQKDITKKKGTPSTKGRGKEKSGVG